MSYPILKPNSSWFAPTLTTTKRNLITIINIVDSYTPTETVTDSWDASIAQDGSIMCYLDGTTLTIAGNGSGGIKANEDASCMFSDVNNVDYFSSITEINGLSILDTSETHIMTQMFGFAEKLKTFDIENFDTRNSTSFRSMFYRCSSIEELNLSSWDTSKIESLHGAFHQCSSLKSLNVSTWDVSNVTTLQGTFQKCSSLTELDIVNWNTEKVQDFKLTFSNCNSLITLDVSKWNVSSNTTLYQTFKNCEALERLDLSKWNVSNVSSLYATFYCCSKLKEIDVSTWDISNVTNVKACFQDCQSIEKLDLYSWDTKNVADFTQLFSRCYNLKELNISNFDTSSATSMKLMFGECSGLEKLTLGENFTRFGDGTIGSAYYAYFPTPTTNAHKDADGMWHTADGNSYAPADVPDLTAGTYYASPTLAIWDRDSKKYIHLASMRQYHNMLNAETDTKLNALKEEIGSFEDITSEEIQALFK